MPEQPEETSETSKPERRRRPRRRWLRILIALAILLVLLIVVVQAVLWSTLPKSIVLQELTKTLGVKVEAAAVETGWWGTTRVTDVKMTIPLDNGPVLETPVINVKHSSLLSLIIFGFRLESLEIPKPVVHLRQAASGQWNAADLLSGMNSGGGGGGAAGGGAAPASRPQIPAITITDATVIATDNTGRQSQLSPISLVGRPGDTAPDLVWAYEVSLPDIKVSGRVATGGDWRNEARIDIASVRSVLAPFTAAPPDVKLTASWEGRASAGVQGRLVIEGLSVNGQKARGNVSIEQADGKVTIRPEGLSLLKADGQVLATAGGGEIRFESGTLNLSELILRAPGIVAAVNGQFTPGSMAGEAKVSWTASAAPSGVAHEGMLTAAITRTIDNRIEIKTAIDSTGRVVENTARNWNGRIEIDAAGPDFKDLSVSLRFPNFKVVGPRRTFALDGLYAKLAVSENLGERPGGIVQKSSPGLGVALESLQLRDTGQLGAQGFFLPSSQEWSLHFVGKGLPLPKFASDAVGLEMKLSGDEKLIKVTSVRLAASDTVVEMSGGYDMSQPQPLSVKVVVNHVPPETDKQTQALGGAPVNPPLIRGLLAAEGNVSGTLKPINLAMSGQVQGIRVQMLGRDLGDMSVKVKGYADKNRAQLWRDPEGPPLSILGGLWELEATHILDQEASTLTFGVRDLPLKEVGEFLGNAQLAGTAEGSWAVYVPTYVDLKQQVRAGGKLVAKNVVANGYQLDTITAWTAVDKGRAALAPLQVERLKGVFTATPSFALNDFKTIDIDDIRLEQWPVALPPNTFLTVNASSPYLRVHLGDAPKPPPTGKPASMAPLAPGMTFASGPITAHSTVAIGDLDAGDVRLNAVLNGRTLGVTLLTANVLGSSLEAQAKANLDTPNATTATMSMTNIDPKELTKLVPALRAVSGTMDLTLAVGPDDDARALEPMVAELKLKSNNVYYHPVASQHLGESSGIRIGDGHFRASILLDPHFQLDRATLADQSGLVSPVSNECPPKRTGPLPINTLELSGGEMQVWARAVRNENDRNIPNLTTLSSHLRLGFRCLDLNQILQAFKPDDKPVPGFIDGNLVLYGTSGLELDSPIATADAAASNSVVKEAEKKDSFLTYLLLAMQGEGTLKLRNSDLGNIQAIAFLYDVMRIGQDVRVPTGNGELNFRIENGNAFITAFRYFNRGIEVRAIGTVKRLFELQQAEVQANVFGTLRTLKGVELPILRSVVPDLEAVLDAIQKNGTSITVNGPLGKPQMRVVLFEELGKAMQELLLGDYKSAQNAPPK